ncbi:hypothetical protein GALL_476780 [mine drainage metagenome]|uniref:Uncharacterized protein n=1 Tax=mine drainage metagenome TaxID=410659 RepID=A0A1J5PZJ7_9ZZZZ
MEETVDDYLEKHLPYRVNCLLAIDLIAHRRSLNISKELKSGCYQDSLVLEPAFEISIVFGRALLNFLGIGYNFKENTLTELEKIKNKIKPDDFTLQKLFPMRSFCSLNDEIIVKYNIELCTLMKIADKSVAHLTTKFSNDQEHLQLEPARKAIYQLILKYVPEINKKGIWWHEQVGT